MKVDVDGNLHSDKTGKFIAKDGSSIDSARTDREWTKKISPKTAIDTLKANVDLSIKLCEKAVEYFQKVEQKNSGNKIKLVNKVKELESKALDLLNHIK